jgi:hypothetical protein
VDLLSQKRSKKLTASEVNLQEIHKAKMEGLLDKFMKNYVYDYFTSILVMKLTFSILEQNIEEVNKWDNTMIYLNDEMKKYVNTQPVCLVFISHDDYDKIEN